MSARLRFTDRRARGLALGARLSNASRAPSSRASRGSLANSGRFSPAEPAYQERVHISRTRSWRNRDRHRKIDPSQDQGVRMKRREFLIGAAAAAGLASGRKGWAQTRDQAKLARVAIMSLCFNRILKNPSQPDNPARTLDIMHLGQMLADRYGVHNVEMQHAHFPSTEPAYLMGFRDRLAKTMSRVTNINLEFGPQNISAADPALRQQALDRTREWIGYAVAVGCPRIMVNQGAPTQENKDAAIATLKAMGDYGK